MANKYPTVILHGFMGFGKGDWINDYLLYYWGFKFFWNQKNKVIPHLEKQGYEVYNPPLGPWNSAWDRCCILWAYLMGGTVDYGKAHSEKFGHARFGRTYPGVLKDWGKPGNHEKINIIGHSLGGSFVIAFSDMLRNGSAEERVATPESELSPLFKGGQGDLLHTVTTLAGVNNGTTMASTLMENGGYEKVMKAVCYGVGTIGNMGFMTHFWDQRLDQWGITANPEDKPHFIHIAKPDEYRDGAIAYSKAKEDNVGWQMTLEYMKETNKNHVPNPNTYYFAYVGEASKKKLFKNEHKPIWSAMNFVPYFAGWVTGSAWSKEMSKVYKKHHKKKEWLPNDGFVNVLGQRAPFNAPQEEFSPDKKLKPGIWYNMPTAHQCHLSWNGAHIPHDQFFDYMDDMFARNASLK